MRYETVTGLSHGQLAELAARVATVTGGVARPGGRPAAIGLFRSVALVVALMRTSITQELAGAIFGCSQPTVSRRWDLIRPVIGQVSPPWSPPRPRSSARRERPWPTARSRPPGTGRPSRTCTPARPATRA